MRYLFYLILVLLISCKGNLDKNGIGNFSNLQFSLDTVHIDPGDEIIFLKYQLSNTDISKDGKYLFNFNEHDHTIEKINLDELRLEAKLPFEKEGPNGTGPSLGAMKVYDENQITILGRTNIALFSLDGEKLNTIHFETFYLEGEPIQGSEHLGRIRRFNTIANRLYGIIYTYDDKSFALGIFNLENFEITRLELENFKNLPNFDIVYKSNGIEIGHREGANIEQYGTKVILSNGITNALMWYDTDMDSIFIKSYNSELTANRKEKEYIMEHETIEGFEAEKAKMKQEINFMGPVWDEKSQHFYKLSYEELPTSSAGGGIKAKVYLTVLDSELNQLGEALVPQLTKRPAKHFVKDGKIWIYENMDDEMAFLRLEIGELN